MKKLLILILAMAFASTAFGQGIYRLVFEAGDTLVAATRDTSVGCLIYNNNSGTTRPIRPTLFIDATEIGTNTSHYWLQYEVSVAIDNLDKDDSGWASVYKGVWYDWVGFAEGDQNDMAIPMPFLESYGALYFRVVLLYTSGLAADSTSYKLTYGGDKTGNMYSPPERLYRQIPHEQLFRTGDEKLCDSADVTVASSVVDMRIEITPGRFVLPTRAYLQTGEGRTSGTGTTDDSLTVYITSYLYHRESTLNIDTLTVPLNGAAELSFSLSSGTGFVDAIQLQFYNGDLGGSDSTWFYASLGLEYRP